MKLPKSYFNYISYLGTIIALIAWVAIIFLIVLAKMFDAGNVYFELFTYLIVPGFLVAGLLIIPIGMYLQNRREKKGFKEDESKRLIFDFNDPKTRNAAIIFSVVTVFFVLFTVIGSYKGFHYTESVEFCGTLCHEVMEPEYVAYQYSSHARVKCAECHVGEGVDFYVKSKMSGLRQVFKYIAGTYPTPIETPIRNLRPARETCEKCHWPEKFYTNKIRHEKYYLADSSNTEWDIIMKMKIGPDHAAMGQTEGIHWHINPNIEMEYASDEKREIIPWVKYKNKLTGVELVFKSEENEITEDSLSKMEKRPFDCMDCHNRPSHEYHAPSYFVNHIFTSGEISSKVPYLKAAAMDALNDIYSTKDSAKMGIENKIIQYYTDQYPDVLATFEKEIKAAIPVIYTAYSRNTFPEMKVRYTAYPRHIGHLESNGCSRCHDGKHKTAEGKVISRDCSVCHTFIGQGVFGKLNYATIDSTMEFQHPVDIDNAWKESNCSECHVELY
ncbi:MAG: cytochrome C [Bacteroidetes bacterium GWA2_31_9]|nr:MAG: cytochrome C [Bacteroidetes bacterium GWA2_31_9]